MSLLDTQAKCWQPVTSRYTAFHRQIKTKVRPVRVACSAKPETSTASVREWRQNWRYHRYQKASEHLPKLDWRRYHLQVLFVDRTDTVRARVATGLFDRIAGWNGFGRALYPSACGTEPEAEQPGIALTAGLMGQAGALGIPPKLFSRPGEKFEWEDFYRNDIVLAVDDDVRSRLQRVAETDVDSPQEVMAKVALLTDFRGYCGREDLLKTGGSAVLEPELSQIITPALSHVQHATSIRRPTLVDGAQEWNEMVQIMVVSCAGLVRYLVDAYPPDLPEYDPV